MGKWDKYIVKDTTAPSTAGKMDKWAKYAVKKSQEDQNPIGLPKYNQTMKTIEERPSTIQEIRNDAPKNIGDMAITVANRITKPFGSTARDVQRTVGAGFEIAEGIPSSVGLNLQKGNVKDIPSDIGKVVKGDMPAQAGDIIRTTGFGGKYNEAISATVGGAALLANPLGPKAVRATGQATVQAGKVAKEAMTPNPDALINKAEKLTTEIIQPTKREMTDYLTRGQQLPAVEQATKVISKSKNYIQLRNNIDNVIKDTMGRRNELLRKNNYKVDNSYIGDLESLIKQEKASGQMTPQELSQMTAVLNRERTWYNANKNSLTRLMAQQRKEKLQDLTDSLLQKLESGDIIDTQPARTRALNALRRGLKNSVDGGEKEVMALNETYGGLKRAKELVAGQEALTNKAVDEGLIHKVMRMITSPGDIPTIMAREAVIGRAKSLSSTTNKIESLRNRAEAIRAKNAMNRSLGHP